METARRLLALEGATGSAGDGAAAAGRVYDKLHAHLAPLLGVAGVQLLFARSARLVGEGFACVTDAASVETSAKLRECLQGQDPAVALEAATALFGAFFALMATFIGHRLTLQVLRRAWPTIVEMLSGETGK